MKPVVIGKLNTALIESVFNHGASIVAIFPSNWRKEPTWQLFTNDGKPVPELVAIARDFDKLQAPITDGVVVVSNTIK